MLKPPNKPEMRHFAATLHAVGIKPWGCGAVRVVCPADLPRTQYSRCCSYKMRWVGKSEMQGVGPSKDREGGIQALTHHDHPHLKIDTKTKLLLHTAVPFTVNVCQDNARALRKAPPPEAPLSPPELPPHPAGMGPRGVCCDCWP